MKVSVIVPLYNKAPWVRRSLDSLAAQTFRDFEVIVVDDGSTDDGAKVVAEYPDDRIRLVRQKNAGPGAARNRGIGEARGELLAFLDADDEWTPDFLEENVRALEAAGPKVGAIVCGYVEYPSRTTRARMWERRGVREGIFRATPEVPASRLVHLLAYMNPWATVVRAKVLQRHGGFYGRDRCLYGEDAYLWLKVLLNEPVLFTLAPRVHFHTEASALSKNLKGARPVEPFLQYPEELEATCPGPLRPLLRQVLSIRASKTACMLSYWGRWEEARALLERFSRDRSLTQPWAATAVVCSNPLGVAVARAWRKVLRPLSKVAQTSAQASQAAVPVQTPLRPAEHRRTSSGRQTDARAQRMQPRP